MHAFPTKRRRASQPIVSAPRSNRRRQRIYFRLRNLGRAVVSAMIGIASSLLKALQDSRSQMAARVIDEHRHLLEGAAPAANAAAVRAQQNDGDPSRELFMHGDVVQITKTSLHVLRR